MKKGVWISAALAVVVCALIAVVDPWGWRAEDPVVMSGPASVAPTEDGTSDRSAVDAAAALRALPSDVVSGAASSVREVVAEDPEGAVPQGATIDAEPSTWIRTGPDSGSIAMEMAVPGEASSRQYIALMVEEEGAWRLESTVEAEPAG